MRSSTSSDRQAGFSHAAAVMVIVLVFVGASGAYVFTHHKKSQVNNNDSKTTASLPSNLSTVKSLDDVVQLAAQQEPAAAPTAAEVGQEDGTTVFRLSLSNHKKLTFNALTGALISSAADDENEDNPLPAKIPAGIITVTQARDAALAAHQGTVQSIKIDDEEGVVTYSVRFTDGTRVAVNAQTGTVVRTQTNNRSSSSSTTGGSGSESGTKSSTTSESGTETHGGTTSSGSGTTESGSASGSGSETEDQNGSGSNSNSGSGSGGSGSGDNESGSGGHH